jgi:hypothetical protein
LDWVGAGATTIVQHRLPTAATPVRLGSARAPDDRQADCQKDSTARRRRAPSRQRVSEQAGGRAGGRAI